MLVDRNKEEIEGLPEKRVFDGFPDFGPSVVFGAGISSFSCKIEGQADAPEQYEQCEENQSRIGPATEGQKARV